MTAKELGSWAAYWNQFDMANSTADYLIPRDGSAPVPVREKQPVPVRTPTGAHKRCESSVNLYTYTRPAPGKHARNVKVGHLCECGTAIID